MAACRSLCIWS